MKNKLLLTSVIALVVLVGLFLALNAYIYNEKQAEFTVGQTREFKGAVLAVDLTKSAYDGPVIISLVGDDGKNETVAVPSMGLPLCAAYQAKNIGDVYLIKPGDQFEVRGSVNEDGYVVPCESADHYLRPVPLVVPGFEGEADPNRMTLIMQPWSWVLAQYNDGREVKPKKADKFTLTFAQNKGQFVVTTDCNSGGGSYALGANNHITLRDIISTKMFCEGSQEGEFFQLLSNVDSYHFTSKGELIFDLKFDSGSVIFR